MLHAFYMKHIFHCCISKLTNKDHFSCVMGAAVSAFDAKTTSETPLAEPLLIPTKLLRQTICFLKLLE